MFIFKVSIEEIDRMISTVDRNGDGRISYSEFRLQSHPEKNAKSISKELTLFQGHAWRFPSDNTKRSKVEETFCRERTRSSTEKLNVVFNFFLNCLLTFLICMRLVSHKKNK